jgi:hypothetical protein
MPKAKTGSEIVAKSNKSRGITPVGLRLSPEEISLLDEMAARLGGRKAAIMAGLAALDRNNDLTQDQVIDWIRRNAG